MWYNEVTLTDTSKYYSYIFVYVDNILIIDNHPSKYMPMIEDQYTVKPGRIDIPKTYLGAGIYNNIYDDGSYSWSMGSESNVKKVVDNATKRLQEDYLEFNNKLSDKHCSCPQVFPSVSYRLEFLFHLNVMSAKPDYTRLLLV